MAAEAGRRGRSPGRCGEIVAARQPQHRPGNSSTASITCQIADKDNTRQTVGSHNGCEIDQVLRPELGLSGRAGPDPATTDNVKKALASLWKYNFTPDVGPVPQAHPAGRWYAMAGEGGPADVLLAQGRRRPASATGFDYYFNECMTGFEYQVAGHMIWEGLVQEGLAVDAGHPRPLSRLAAQPLERGRVRRPLRPGDGQLRRVPGGLRLRVSRPEGHLAFAPASAPEDFRAAFTTAEGWGTFRQKRDGRSQRDCIEVKWGKLRLRTLAFTPPEQNRPEKVTVAMGGKAVPSTYAMDGQRVVVTLAEEIVVEAGQTLEIEIA